jgi:hypothetical protein
LGLPGGGRVGRYACIETWGVERGIRSSRLTPRAGLSHLVRAQVDSPLPHKGGGRRKYQLRGSKGHTGSARLKKGRGQRIFDSFMHAERHSFPRSEVVSFCATVLETCQTYTLSMPLMSPKFIPEHARDDSGINSVAVATKTHILSAWECRPGRSASPQPVPQRSRGRRRGASKTAFRRGTVGTRTQRRNVYDFSDSQ